MLDAALELGRSASRSIPRRCRTSAGRSPSWRSPTGAGFCRSISTACSCAVRAELRAMLATGGGSIVSIGSVLGLRGHPDVPTYVTAKHALIGLHRSVAMAYSAQAIRANVVCPGYISTPMLSGDMDEVSVGRARRRSSDRPARHRRRGCLARLLARRPRVEFRDRGGLFRGRRLHRLTDGAVKPVAFPPRRLRRSPTAPRGQVGAEAVDRFEHASDRTPQRSTRASRSRTAAGPGRTPSNATSRNGARSA